MAFDFNLFFLWAILYLLGYLATFASVRHNLSSRRMLPALTAAFLFLYLCAMVFSGLLYQYFGDDVMVLYWILVCYVLGLAAYLVRLLWRDRAEISRQPLLFLFANLAMVLYITLGSRLSDMYSREVRMVPFQNLILAVSTGTLSILNHSILNMLLFLPTGILLALLGPRRMRRVEIGFLLGLVLSVAIETVQLTAKLGTCDLDDIISNALGAAVGVLLCNLLIPRRPARRH